MMISKYLRNIQCRYWSNDQLLHCLKFLKDYDSVINVSGWEDGDKEGSHYEDYFSNAKIYNVSNYPNDIKKGVTCNNDIKIDLSKKLNDSLIQKYNIVVNHTVLEHVEDPVFAFKQMALMTNDLMISVVPWIQQLHFIDKQFGDYYRFSPMIMRKMYKDNGFELIYENYMPSYASDCYLINVGTKKPKKHLQFPINLKPINELNGVVGRRGLFSSVINIVLRSIGTIYQPKKNKVMKHPIS